MIERHDERMIVGHPPSADIQVGRDVIVDYPGLVDLHKRRFTVVSIDEMVSLGWCATLDTKARYPQKWAFDVTLPLKYLIPAPKPSTEDPR